MKTEKRYWNEPFVFEGEATLLERTAWKDLPAFTLDRSLFYPEGGGQKGDRGVVTVGAETRQVIDTQIDDAGQIFLVLDQSLSEANTVSTFTYCVDEAWRRRQMSQHTAQHLLSGLLHDEYKAPTVSARLGETFFSLEVDSTSLSWSELCEAETKLNALILEDRPIRAWFPSPEELAGLSLRKQPSVAEGIRVIQVEGLDVTPCGGTHCASTGQIGLIHVQSMERYKGMTRLYVSAGLDLARDFQRKEETLQSIQALVDANTETVLKQVEALKQRAQLAEQEKQTYLDRAVAQEARVYVSADQSAVTMVALNDVSDEYARRLTRQIAHTIPTIAIVSVHIGEEVLIVLEQATATGFMLGKVLSPIIAEQGGKGGGGPTHAEVRISHEKAEACLKAISEMLQVVTSVR